MQRGLPGRVNGYSDNDEFMMKHDKQAFKISVRVVKERLKAILVSDGTIEAWLPKSQITFLSRYNERRETTINIPKWLAKEKGFLK